MRLLRVLLLCAPCLAASHAARAAPDEPAKRLDPAVLAGLAAEDSAEKIEAIRALAIQAGPGAVPVLQALADDRLQVAGGRVLVADGEALRDAATGAILPAPPDGAEAVTINNRVRRALEGTLSALRVFDPDRTVRLAAATSLASSVTPELLPLLDEALAAERDGAVREPLALARAQVLLRSDDRAARLDAVRALGEGATRNVRALLTAAAADEPDPEVRAAAARSLGAVERRLLLADVVNSVFSGLSLGSILLLAALGLAITYGIMGVINMAHGELLMVGAYAGYAVQTFFRRSFPAAQDVYVLAAIPVAFAAAFTVGVLMERLVIRHLYRRPLESLLATWGLSLVLIQTARAVFGAQNVQVANPSWMSGGVSVLPSAVLPWNRIAIVCFSAGVLLVTWLLLQKTRLGMFVRAVTQNRAMAGCVGVPTGRVDSLAFGLGAGIAGLGGLALAQIGNVGPDMGQLYVVDSFMVVVLGGVGQLAGAVLAALGLGVAAKFLEGATGAVVAKILVLAFIVIFIQKRPQGLFALKGRAVEG
ncbi:MAG TPA: urea ABC transporter permease subunit UrtB [Anaeromyxobacter sp.]|nr:urea ABC transporter permease subunit UrtB [Anaeromyxobacter sp.]